MSCITHDSFGIDDCRQHMAPAFSLCVHPSSGSCANLSEDECQALQTAPFAAPCIPQQQQQEDMPGTGTGASFPVWHCLNCKEATAQPHKMGEVCGYSSRCPGCRCRIENVTCPPDLVCQGGSCQQAGASSADPRAPECGYDRVCSPMLLHMAFDPDPPAPRACSASSAHSTRVLGIDTGSSRLVLDAQQFPEVCGDLVHTPSECAAYSTPQECPAELCLWQDGQCTADSFTQTYATGQVPVTSAVGTLDVAGVKVRPYCTHNLPSSDRAGLIGMALNVDGDPRNHSFMNAVQKPQFAVDKGTGKVCLGCLLPAPAHAITATRQPYPDPKSSLHVPVVRDPDGHLLVLDTGSTQSMNFGAPPLCKLFGAMAPEERANTCLVGNEDIRFLQVNGDQIMYDVDTAHCKFAAAEADLLQNRLKRQLLTEEHVAVTQFQAAVCACTACNCVFSDSPGTGEQTGEQYNYWIETHIGAATPAVQVCSTERTIAPRGTTSSHCTQEWHATGVPTTGCSPPVEPADGTYAPFSLHPTDAGVLRIFLPTTPAATSLPLQLGGSVSMAGGALHMTRREAYCPAPCLPAMGMPQSHDGDTFMTQELAFTRHLPHSAWW